MTELHFQKWQATGNDFVIVDNRDGVLKNLSPEWINGICDRKFGIGADGFMFVNKHPKLDFEMKYFNADGYEAEMCGNGARSIIGFTYLLGMIGQSTEFLAIDGQHHGWVIGADKYKIQLVDVEAINQDDKGIFLNTGVPHLVVFCEDPSQIDVVKEGREIRNNPDYAPKGTNVNFVNSKQEVITMRTYERGVENETLSCGTGAVASAIATEFIEKQGLTSYQVKVPGGQLLVKFKQTGPNSFQNICLEGEAKKVFEGTIKLEYR